MILFLPTITTEEVVCFDLEHDCGALLQFGGVRLRRIGESLYQVSKSINIYVKKYNVSPFIEGLTKLSAEKLERYGEHEVEAETAITDFFNCEDTITFCSHGIKQDMEVLMENDITLPIHQQICTLSLSGKKSLEKAMAEAGLGIFEPHNAYADAVGCLSILSFYLKQEEVK